VTTQSAACPAASSIEPDPPRGAWAPRRHIVCSLLRAVDATLTIRLGVVSAPRELAGPMFVDEVTGGTRV